jgi:hypothetical protein
VETGCQGGQGSPMAVASGGWMDTSLQRVSTRKRSSSGNISDTFWQQVQRSESADVKFNLVCGVYCVP